MKVALPVLTLFTATAAQAHEGGHLHPHEANSWFVSAMLFVVCLAAGYLIGRVHR
jgi:p-aminobenzoyl-glutamate transporter AbgT